MNVYIIERFGHRQTFYGETAGKAKYQAWLESESGYDFPDYLKTIESCRKDKFYRPQRDEIPELYIGDKVEMHTCLEASKYAGRIWTVLTEPQKMCGTWVVWLEGFTGCFACEFLKVVTP